jgi:EAL domain-containing protein (putative c-di-GMP-specific phosphodiesterase class I)
LKIDKGFVNGIGSDPDDEAICRTIILLARDLKLQVIAEGVSTEQQLDFLRTNGCDAAQGYLFSGNPIAREESAVLS